MRWEYLRVLIHTASTGPHWAPLRVDVIGDDGQMIEWKKQQGEKSHTPVVSRLLKKLGDDGWELAGTVPTPDNFPDILYFKRPKAS
jgi:hypothetical protein